MYQRHFQLARAPFAATADCYYPATAQEQAFARLATALETEHLAALVGPTGVGKTLLAQRLLQHLTAGRQLVWITNTHFADLAALFQAVLYDLDQPYAEHSEQELRLRVTDCILDSFKSGRGTLLALDEAQHLVPRFLEELRLLTNLDSTQSRVLQVFLVGQPELLQTLRLPELAALAQRLAPPARLEPMNVHESADYLLHHLRAAGGNPERIITDEALDTLARGSLGIPRLLNQTADAAFRLAFAAGEAVVDVEAALEALNERGLGDALEDTVLTLGARPFSSAMTTPGPILRTVHERPA